MHLPEGASLVQRLAAEMVDPLGQRSFVGAIAEVDTKEVIRELELLMLLPARSRERPVGVTDTLAEASLGQ